jgi:hypothetical protein
LRGFFRVYIAKRVFEVIYLSGTGRIRTTISKQTLTLMHSIMVSSHYKPALN